MTVILKQKVLIDSDVLIDYLRGVQKAVNFIEQQVSHHYISSISIAELYAGTRTGAEEKLLHNLLSIFTVVEVTADIAKLGGHFRRQYFKSHGMGLADALIAACAQSHTVQLATLNSRHFPMFDDTYVPYRKLQ